MNDVERKLKQLGEHAETLAPAELAPRASALRRIRLRRRLLSGSLVLCTVLTVAGGVALSADREPDVADVKPAEEKPDDEKPVDRTERSRCGLSFEPTYLPAGLKAKPRPASGGNEELPAEPPHPIAHFRGPVGTFVDVTLSPGRGFSQTERERITVLGTRAMLGSIHEGFSVAFELGRCRYGLLAYGLERRELRLFAEGLVSTTARGPQFGAVWPEDTVAEARRGCVLHQNRSNPEVVASRFAREILRWGWTGPRPSVSDPRLANGTIELTITYDAVREAGVEPGVRLWMDEVLPDCWSVVGVSPVRERRMSSIGISVHGRTAQISFARHGATSATVEFGYGTHESATTWHAGDEGVTTLLVSGGRNRTGHFLVLLRNSEGNPFSAIGRPLPPGDFAAG